MIFWGHTVESDKTNSNSCDRPSTNWWVVVMCKPHPASMPMIFTASCPWPYCERIQAFGTVSPGCTLGHFQSIDRNDVIKKIIALPDKQRASVPIPTCLLKACASDLARFLSWLFTASLQAGVFPSTFKSAFVTSILKKSGPAEDDTKNDEPSRTNQWYWCYSRG